MNTKCSRFRNFGETESAHVTLTVLWDADSLFKETPILHMQLNKALKETEQASPSQYQSQLQPKLAQVNIMTVLYTRFK